MKKAYIAFLLVLMYVPIALVIIYSFNANRLNSVWSGFTLAWYRELFRDRAMFAALRNSLVLATISSVSAAVIGTLGAVGMAWGKTPGKPMGKNGVKNGIKNGKNGSKNGAKFPNGKLKGIMEYLSILPIMTPEIILGMVLLVFFSLIGLPLGMLTLVLAHTCFCIP